MTSFNQKVVWITGASSGIGEALAYAFAKEGAKLVLTARRVDELERVKKACTDASKIMVLQMDLEERRPYEKEAKQVLNEMGQVDILINNAGLTQRGLVKDTTLEVDYRIMELNFFGAVRLTKAVLPSMIQRKSGQIVAISSYAGRLYTPLRASYNASKYAMQGYFDALRSECWVDNIQVLVVSPGFIKTNISLHALTGDGTPQKKMDTGQAKGIDPAVLASKILKAIKKGKENLLVGGRRENFGYLVNRFFPRIYSKLVRRLKVT